MAVLLRPRAAALWLFAVNIACTGGLPSLKPKMPSLSGEPEVAAQGGEAKQGPEETQEAAGDEPGPGWEVSPSQVPPGPLATLAVGPALRRQAAVIGNEAPYHGRYDILVHPIHMDRLGLQLGDYVRLLPPPDLEGLGIQGRAKMFRIAGSGREWWDDWERAAVRMGASARRRLFGSEAATGKVVRLEPGTRDLYPVTLWGSQPATRQSLVDSDAVGQSIALPPIAMASLGVEVGDRIRVWRDGNGNAEMDDAGHSCGTVDLPPCFAHYLVTLSYASEVQREMPARMSQRGRNRLALEAGDPVILDRRVPGLPAGPVVARIDSAPELLKPDLVDAADAKQRVALPSALREALTLQVGDLVRMVVDDNSNHQIDPGEHFLNFTIVADYDIPPRLRKYNRVRMGATARASLGLRRGSKVLLTVVQPNPLGVTPHY